MIRFIAGFSVALLLGAAPLAAIETVARGSGIAADVASDGRVVIDLLGDIWIVPAGGGKATAVTSGRKSVRRPRWSPDAGRIAYQAASKRSQAIWIYDLSNDESTLISRDTDFDVQPAWHPDGRHIVYASDPSGDGFDLWEVDLTSGLRWRISDRDGDETEPAWSANGRDLVYVHHQDEQWSLVLRRRALPEEILVTGTDRLGGPSWRPDGSLVTYFRQRADGTSIEMVILSQPRLARSYAGDEGFTPAPVSWLDRHRMFYTADGLIRQRLFNAWKSSPLPFVAAVHENRADSQGIVGRRQLPRTDEPPGRLVVHAARIFDGVRDDYLTDMDIVIDGGRISAVEPHRDRPDTNRIDMGDLTVLPGFIDANADLQAAFDKFGDDLGPLLLMNGITTIVAEYPAAKNLNTLWSGKVTPGPRLLHAADWPVPGVSAIADSSTPGLGRLLQSRQAKLLGMSVPPRRRFAEPPGFGADASAVVMGSVDNGMPPGIALHAELSAMVAAGLRPQQALRAAGVNAAAALRLDPWLGRIAVGAAADLVFVDGSPLAGIEDALKIVAVVRNGRFYSVSGLIDRVEKPESVE